MVGKIRTRIAEGAAIALLVVSVPSTIVIVGAEALDGFTRMASDVTCHTIKPSPPVKKTPAIAKPAHGQH